MTSTRTVPDCVSKQGFALDLLKAHGRKPLRAANLRNVVAFAVDEPLSGYDLAIRAVEWMFASVRHPNHKLPQTPDAQIYFADRNT